MYSTVFALASRAVESRVRVSTAVDTRCSYINTLYKPRRTGVWRTLEHGLDRGSTYISLG